MDRREFEKSQFDEQEDWERDEAERRADFHGDRRRVGRANTANSMLKKIHQRNLQRIQNEGIGYSKDAGKRTGRE